MIRKWFAGTVGLWAFVVALCAILSPSQGWPGVIGSTPGFGASQGSSGAGERQAGKTDNGRRTGNPVRTRTTDRTGGPGITLDRDGYELLGSPAHGVGSAGMAPYLAASTGRTGEIPEHGLAVQQCAQCSAYHSGPTAPGQTSDEVGNTPALRSKGTDSGRVWVPVQQTAAPSPIPTNAPTCTEQGTSRPVRHRATPTVPPVVVPTPTPTGTHPVHPPTPTRTHTPTPTPRGTHAIHSHVQVPTVQGTKTDRDKVQDMHKGKG